MGYPLIYTDCEYPFFEKVRDAILQAEIEDNILMKNVGSYNFTLATYSKTLKTAFFDFPNYGFCMQIAKQFKPEKVPYNLYAFEMWGKWDK